MCWAETPSPSSLESEFSILINKWKIIWNSRRGVEIHQWSFRFLRFLLPARVSGSDSVGWPSAQIPPFSLPDSVLWPLVTQQLGAASSPELARRCLGTRCYRVGTGFRLGFISFKTSQCYWGFIVYQAPCFTSFHPHEPILRFSGSDMLYLFVTFHMTAFFKMPCQSQPSSMQQFSFSGAQGPPPFLLMNFSNPRLSLRKPTIFHNLPGPWLSLFSVSSPF